MSDSVEEIQASVVSKVRGFVNLENLVTLYKFDVGIL